MSAEHFDTALTADMATADDGHGVLIAPSMSQSPRWLTPNGHRSDAPRSWAACHVSAELAVRVAAEAVLTQPMDGLTGDHPAKRARLAALLSACADMVRDLALDAAYDGEVTDDYWAQRLEDVITLANPVVTLGCDLPTPDFDHTVIGWEASR